MGPKVLRFLTIIGLLTVLSTEIKATHIVGGVIEYVRLGPGSLPNSSRYKIILRLWRDAAGNPWFPGTVRIEVRGDTTGLRPSPLGGIDYIFDPVTTLGVYLTSTVPGSFPTVTGLARMTFPGNNFREVTSRQFIRDFNIGCSSVQDTFMVRIGAITSTIGNNNSVIAATSRLPSYENPEYVHTIGGYPSVQFMANNFGFTTGVHNGSCNSLSANPRPATLANACTNGRVCVPPFVDSCTFAPEVYIQYATYIRVVDLPNIPGGYHLIYRICCRNNAIQNLNNPGSQSSSAYARIPDIALLDDTKDALNRDASFAALITALGGNVQRATVPGAALGLVQTSPGIITTPGNLLTDIRDRVRNSNPKFRSTPPLFVCRYNSYVASLGINQNPEYDHSAFDFDGDDMEYELVAPTKGEDFNNGANLTSSAVTDYPWIGNWSLGAKNINGRVFNNGDRLFNTVPFTPFPQNVSIATFEEVNYQTGFSDKLPLGQSSIGAQTVPGIVLNTLTGALLIQPALNVPSSSEGLYVVMLRAREFRRMPDGTRRFMGEAYRDYQFRVLNCPLPAQALIGNTPACTGTNITMNNQSTAASTIFYWDNGRDAYVNSISGVGVFTPTITGTTQYQIISTVTTSSGTFLQPLQRRRLQVGNTISTTIQLDAQAANTSSGINPSFDFGNPGTYFVKLVVQGRGGKCSDSAYAAVAVGSVKAGWNQNPSGPICVFKSINFDPFASGTNGTTTVSGTSDWTNSSLNPVPMKPFVSVTGTTTITGFEHYWWMHWTGSSFQRFKYPPTTAISARSQVQLMRWNMGDGTIQLVTLSGTGAYGPAGGYTVAGGSFISGLMPRVTLTGFGSNPLSIPGLSYAYANAGTYNVVQRVTNQFGCSDSLTRSITVIQAQPTAAATAGQVCNNNPITTISGTVTIASGAIWGGGLGTYSPSRTMSGTNLALVYTLSSSESSLSGTSFVNFTMTTTGNGVCPAGTATGIVLTVVSRPTVSAGPDATVCGNNLKYTLSGAVSGLTNTGQWSTMGTGTFVGSNASTTTILGDVYRWSKADSTSGNVRLILSSTNNGLCSPVRDTMRLILQNPAFLPQALAGNDQVICTNVNRVNLNGIVSFSGGGGIWTTSGTGFFGPFNSATLNSISGANAYYTPSAADINARRVRLTLVTNITPANGACSNVSDHVDIAFAPAPTARVSYITPVNGAFICGNNQTITLTGTITGATGATWSTNGVLPGSFVPSVINPALGLVSVNTFSGDTYTTQVVFQGAGNSNLLYFPTFTLSSTGNGFCTGTTAGTGTIIQFPTPTLSITGSNPIVICKNNPNFGINAQVSSFVSLDYTTTGFSNGTGILTLNNTSTTNITGQYQPSTADTNNGAVRIILNSSVRGCRIVSDTLDASFSNPPVVNAGSNQTICGNNLIATVSGAFTTPASGVLWSTNGTGVFQSSGGPSSTAANDVYLPSATDQSNGGVTLNILTTGTQIGGGQGQCSAVSDQMSISFSSPPSIVMGSIPAVCANNNVFTITASVIGQNINTQSIGVWYGGTGTYQPNNANFSNFASPFGLAIQGSLEYTPSASELAALNVPLSVSISGLNNCAPISASTSISISPSPTVSISSSSTTVCANNPAITLNGAVSGASGGIWTGGLGTLNISNGGLSASYTPTTTEILSGAVSFNFATTGAQNNCADVDQNYVVTITASPTVSVGADLTLCAADVSGQVTGTITGATGGIWTTNGTGTFAQATIVGGNMTTTYTPSASDRLSVDPIQLTLTTYGSGNCVNLSQVMNLSFSTVPVANAGSDQTVCLNDLPIMLFASGSAGQWSVNEVGGTFDFATSLANNQYRPATGNPTVLVFTWTTNPNGSCPSVSDNMVVTVLSAPFVSISGTSLPSNLVCANAAGNNQFSITGIARNSYGVNIPATWTSNGFGKFSNNLSFSTKAAGNLTEVYTLTPQDVAQGYVDFVLTGANTSPCSPNSDTLRVVVIGNIVANAGPASLEVCDNVTSINLNASVLVGGSVNTNVGVNWSVLNGPIVPGTFSPNNSSVAQTTVYTPAAGDPTHNGGIVVLSITASTFGGCSTNITGDVVTITYKPSPVVSFSAASQTIAGICSDLSSLDLAVTFSGAARVVWNTNGSTANIFPDNTGSVVDINSTTKRSSINYVLSQADINRGSIQFGVRTDLSGVCSNFVTTSLTSPIQIRRKPILNVGTYPGICDNNTTLTLSGAGLTIGGVGGSGPYTVRWYSSSNSSTFSTSIATSTVNGSGALVGPNGAHPVYTFSGVDRANQLVSLFAEVTDPNPQGCGVQTVSSPITLFAAPTANIGAPTDTYCANINVFTLTSTVTVASGGYWSITGGALGSLTSTGNGLVARYAPVSADRVPGSTLNFRFTTTFTGCQNVIEDKSVVLTPLVTVSAFNTSVCGDAFSTISISGLSSSGAGRWTTTSAGNFFPNFAFTNATSTSVVWVPTQAVKDAAVASGIPIQVVLTSDNNGVCPLQTATASVFILPPPTIASTLSQDICSNTAPITITGSITGFTQAQWRSSGTGTFISGTTLSGVKNGIAFTDVYTPSSLDRNGGSILLTLNSVGTSSGVSCSAVSTTTSFSIIQAPVVDAGVDQTACFNKNNASNYININALVSNGTFFRWQTSNGTGNFPGGGLNASTKYFYSAGDSTTSALGGVVSITALAIGNGPCAQGSDVLTLKITPRATLKIAAADTVCSDTSGVPLSVNISVITTVGVAWSNYTNQGTLSGAFFPNRFSLNPTYVPTKADSISGVVKLVFTTTGNGACEAQSDTVRLRVLPAPYIQPIADRNICNDLNSIQLTFSGANFGRGLWNISEDLKVKWITSGDSLVSPQVANSVDLVKYTFTSGDKARGKVAFVASIENISVTGCKAVSQQFVVSITGAPVVFAGNSQVVCQDNQVISLTGSVIGTENYTAWWRNTNSYTGGSFQSSTLHDSSTVTVPVGGFKNDVYTYTNSQDSPNMNSREFELVVTSAGVCTKIYTSKALVSFVRRTFVTITGPNEICADNPSINLSVVDAKSGPNFTEDTYFPPSGHGIIWTLRNANAVTADQSQYSPSRFDDEIDYFLSGSDKSSTALVASLTTTGNALCPANTAEFTISVTGKPFVTVTSGVLACSNNRMVTLTGYSSTNFGVFTSNSPQPGTLTGLSTNTGIGNIPGTTIPGARLNWTYTVSDAEVLNNQANLILTSTENRACNAVASSLSLPIRNAPGVTAPPDGVVCSLSGITVTGTANPYSTLTGLTWSYVSGATASSLAGFNSTSVSTSTGSFNATSVFTVTGTGGGVVLRFTASEPGCIDVSDDVSYTFLTLPGILAGSPIAACASDGITMTPSSLSGAGYWITNAPGAFQSSGTNSSSLMNDRFVPTGTFSGAAVFSLVGINTGCGLPSPLVSTVQHNFDLGIYADAGNVQEISVCAICKPELPAVIRGTTKYRWYTSGTGTYASNNSQITSTLTGVQSFTGLTEFSCTNTVAGVNTLSGDSYFAYEVYTPTEADRIAKKVILTLEVFPDASTCRNFIRDTLSINFVDAPSAVASGNKVVCANVAVNTNPGLGAVGVSLTGFALFPSPYLTSPLVPDNGARWKVLTGSGYFLSTSSASGVASVLPASVTGLRNQSLDVSDVYIAAASDTVLNSGATVKVVLGLQSLREPSTMTGALCPEIIDKVEVRFTRAPSVNIYTIPGICADLDEITLDARVRYALGSVWSTSGSGSIFPDNVGNGESGFNDITYRLSAAEKNTTTVSNIIFTVQSTQNGSCLPEIGTPLTVTINPKPDISAGTDQTVCGDLTVLSLSGFTVNTFTGTIPSAYRWSTDGNGTFTGFSNISTITSGQVGLTSQYAITEFDRSLGQIQFTLSTTGPNTCKPLTKNISVRFNPRPVMAALPNLEVCNDADNITLSMSASNVGSLAWSAERYTSGSTVAGTGTFTGGNTSTLLGTGVVSKVYQISTADQSADGLLVSATTTGYLPNTSSPQCNALVRTQRVVFTTRPTVTVMGLSPICGNQPGIVLSGSITGALGGRWRVTNGSGTYSPNALPSNPNLAPTTANYALSASDRSLSFLNYQLETLDNGTCKAYVSTAQVSVVPAPTLTAGLYDPYCADTKVISLSNATVGGLGSGSLSWISFGANSVSGAGTNPAAYTYSVLPSDSAIGVITLGLVTNGPAPCGTDTSYTTLRFDQTPRVSVNAGFDQIICSDQAIVNLNGSISNGNTASVEWRAFKQGSVGSRGVFRTGNNVNFPINSKTINPAPTYFPSADDTLGVGSLTNQTVKIYLTVNGVNACSSRVYTDTMNVTFTPRPTFHLLTPSSICSNEKGEVTLTGIFGNTIAGSGLWSTGNGTSGFVPSISNNIQSQASTTVTAIYFPSVADLTRSSLAFAFTTGNQGSCNAIRKDVTMIVHPAPTLDLGANLRLCADNSAITVTGITTGVSNARWRSTGSGTFASNTSNAGANLSTVTGASLGINAAQAVRDVYTYSALDYLAKSFNIELSPVSPVPNNCPADPKLLKVSLDYIPVVSVQPNADICGDQTVVSISGSVTNASGGIWTVSSPGSGDFANASSLNTNYKLSPADIATGNQLAFVLRSTDASSACPMVNSSPVLITLNKPAFATVGAPRQFCTYNEGIDLTASVGNGLQYEWTTTGTGQFSPSKFDADPRYFTSQTDVASGLLSMTIIAYGKGACPNATATTKISLPKEPSPTADGGRDQVGCAGTQVTMSISGFTSANSYTWYKEVNTNPFNPAQRVLVTFAGSNAKTFRAGVPRTLNTDSVYVLVAIKKSNQCTDTARIRVQSLETPVIGIKPYVCITDTLLLPDSHPNNPVTLLGGTFQWYYNGGILLGETNPNRKKANQAGDYTLEYSYLNCVVKDTTTVRPKPDIFTKGRVVCQTEPFSLYATSILGNTLTDADGYRFRWDLDYNRTVNGFAFNEADSLSEAYQTTYRRATYNVSGGITDTSAKYVVQVIDPRFNLNCINYDTLRVKTHPIPDMRILDLGACEFDTISLNATPTNIEPRKYFSYPPSARDTTIRAIYRWTTNPSGLLPNDTLALITITNKRFGGGTYTATYSIGECRRTESSVVSFNKVPTVKNDSIVNYCVDDRTGIVLDAGFAPVDSAYSYLWLATGNVNRYETAYDSTTYFFKVFSRNGCASLDSVRVRHYCDAKVYFPEGFLPSGSNPKDQRYVIFGKYMKDIDFRVYNRWGEVVFASDSIDEMQTEGWDGKFNGQNLPLGVYPFVMKYTGLHDNKKYEKRGSITLVR